MASSISYREAADPQPVFCIRPGGADAFDAQIFIKIPLHDGKERLPGVFMRRNAPFQPAGRALERSLGIFIINAVFAALVELHDNVCAQRVFDLHHFFGRKKVFAPVDMRTEPDALVFDVVEFCEGKDLKPAAVGEDGPVPIHEFVQSSRTADEFVPGPHIKVIGIRKNDLRARLFEIARQNAFYGRLRADGHIDGRFDVSVRGVKNARASARFGIGFDDFKRKFFCQNDCSFYSPVLRKRMYFVGVP